MGWLLETTLSLPSCRNFPIKLPRFLYSLPGLPRGGSADPFCRPRRQVASGLFFSVCACRRSAVDLIHPGVIMINATCTAGRLQRTNVKSSPFEMVYLCIIRNYHDSVLFCVTFLKAD